MPKKVDFSFKLDYIFFMESCDYLVKEGLITDSQLKEALGIQKKNPDRKVGEILLELGYIDIDNFTEVVDKMLKKEGLVK